MSTAFQEKAAFLRESSANWLRFFVLVLSPYWLIAADLPVREVTSLAVRGLGDNSAPAFQNGYLFFLDGASLRLFPPQGSPAITRALNIPAGSNAEADGLAIDSDGSIAVGVEYPTPAGHSGGIVLLDRDGIQTGFIDTGLYMPANLSFAEDHSLWTLGWHWDSQRPDTRTTQDYMLVRHYTADRREAGKYLSRALFPNGVQPGVGSWKIPRIVAAHDKIGLLAGAEWMELGLDGKVLRRVRIGQVGYGEIAFTSDGHLYRSNSGHLEMLKAGTPDWQGIGPSPGHCLMGADGSLLVFSPGGAGPVRLQWFPQP